MAVEVVSRQNVVERVSSLPLVSSTCGLVSSVYCSTKDTHPYLRSVCEAAEHSVRSITSVALSTARPVIGKLEPQIAMANELACKGLDRMEQTLPILQRPSDEIVATAKDAVSSAKDAVSVTVTGVVDRTRGAVHGGVEKTRAAVSGGVSVVLESRVGRIVFSGVDTALSTSENLVDQYLPLTPDELELEEKPERGLDAQEKSYYVRLGSLSTKLRTRAYSRALAKVQDAKQRGQESIAQLSNTVDLIDYARKNIDGANQKVYNKLSLLVEWTSASSNQNDKHVAEAIESRTLALACSLTQQLQTTCLVLASGLQGLPGHVQQEVLSLSRSASHVYAGFSEVVVFRDLPDSVLASSRAHLGRMKHSLDHVMDYVVNNTPLNWLVGPFYPRLPAPPSECPCPQPCTEMEPLASQKHMFIQ